MEAFRLRSTNKEEGSNMAVATGVGVVVVKKKARYEDRLKSALAGVQKDLPATASLVLGGASMTQPEIVKQLQGFLQLFEDVRGAKSLTKQRIGTLRTEQPASHKFYTALEQSLQGYFGKGNPLLADFGYALGARKPRSATAIAAARAKAALTRALRHTMGARQKAAIQVAGRPSIVAYGPDGQVLSGTVPVAKPVGGGSEIAPPPATPAAAAVPAASSAATSSGGA
jgi:hypothetical protein